MKFVGFERSREKLYSHDSLPLSVKDVFMGSPYSWRTCACVVLPLTICWATDSTVASAMLSLPTLAQPARNADSSAPARPIRDDMVTPERDAAESGRGRKLRQTTTKRAVTSNSRADCSQPLQNGHVSGFFDLWNRLNPAKRPEPKG